VGHTVAVIPARGGSKGIPSKNLVDFCGKPLVVWTIEQALAARRIDTVWVSSDDPEILDVSARAGAQTIRRPTEIAGDTASSESCWLHAIDFIEDGGNNLVEILVAPQCTSPVRDESDFDDAMEMFDQGAYDSLFSAASVPDFNIWRSDNRGCLDSFTYDYRKRGRRQEKPDQFLENGSFWIIKAALLQKWGNRLGGRIGTYPMALWKSFQIDEPDDVRLCAALMREYLLTSHDTL
jgi:CMP-N,N'-diacetyllegionaminic acid synthase